MKAAQIHIDTVFVNQLKEKYFNDGKVLSVKAGEYIMHQNKTNERLYLVQKGLVAGYLDSGSGIMQEIFRSEENMFVGVHSFFSGSYSAYADVIALEPTQLAYIDRKDLQEAGKTFNLEDFVPVLVNELSARQLYTKDIMLEKEATLKKLFENEKLATLGQMAAGLAHELNNAIGIMNGNSEWVAGEVYKYFEAKETDTVFSYFEKGFREGQTLSSTEVRKKKQELEKKLNLSAGLAKKLAKLSLEDKDIEKFRQEENRDGLIERAFHFWEMGVAMHDILLASKHSVHVLQSIKQLSVADQVRQEVELNETLNEALILLKNVLRQVRLEQKYTSGLIVMANIGELVQIWVNIIKNACESMINSSTPDPVLRIESTRRKGNAVVTITDNGPGIPGKLQQKIFQPNFTTKKGGLSFGLGLGLSIVQRLVASYNGKIEVNSKKGKTSFTIKLPFNP